MFSNRVEYKKKYLSALFSGGLPTAAAMNAAQQLISCGVAQRRISSTYRLIGHRQASATACPGNTLYNRIRTWPRWVANP